jgi:hypothetical protein
VAKVPPLGTEIVKRSDNMKGFVALPRRWVVERTFSWFGRNRRLAKDFENLAKTLGALLPSPPFSLLSGGLPGRRSPPRQTADLHRTTAKVCKPDCEGTIAGTHGNGEVAPIPPVRRAAANDGSEATIGNCGREAGERFELRRRAQRAVCLIVLSERMPRCRDQRP